MNKLKIVFGTFLKFLVSCLIQSIIPAIIVGVAFLTHKFFPGFWTEVIGISGITTSIIVFLFVGAEERDENVFIFLTTIGTGSFLCMQLLNGYANIYYVPSILLLMSITLTVILIVILLFGNNGQYFSYRRSQTEYFKSGLSKLLAIFVIIGLLVEIYLNYHSQYVWLPAIALTAFVVMFCEDSDIKKFFQYKLGDEIKYVVYFTPIVIAQISTIQRYWNIPVLFGLELLYFFWSVVVILVVIGLCVAYYKVEKYLKKKKEGKINKESEAKQIEEETRQKNEANDKKQKSVQFIVDKISSTNDILLWNDILYVTEYYRNKVNEIPKVVLEKLHLAPLKELITVSEIKQQIVWTRLWTALQIINEYVNKTYTDDNLKNSITQMNEFIKFIDQYKTFEGYDELSKEINRRCPEIFNYMYK